ncbi:MAG: hypothetical protein ACREL9_09155 [Gemmatimonadales bacterium]
MTRRDMHRRLLAAIALVGLGATLPVQGCSPDSVLDVTDPDIIIEANSAAGALALKNGAIHRLTQATTGGEGVVIWGALITDEWRSGDTFVQRNDQDQRLWNPANTFSAAPFRNLNRVRIEGQAAVAALRTFLPSPASNIGLMFAVIAYAENMLGEHYCNGIPLSTPVGSTIVYGDPVPYDSLYILAVNHADSALANRAGPDSTKVRWLASVVKGRALLNRAQFAAAGLAAAGVPDTFKFSIFHSLTAITNQVWGLNNSAKRYTMVDLEGNCAASGTCAGVGLNFIAANDPRLPRRTAASTDRIFDSSIPLAVTRQGKFGRENSVPVATGIEARMIEAEAALRAGDNTTWLTIINRVRTDTTKYPPLGPVASPVISSDATFTRGPALTALADPGTQTAREDIMFRERAFWMFGTGHRLGDLRRLMRQYGRTEAQVYPTGAYYKGGTYGDAIMMSIPFVETNNPNFHECTDRNP